MLIQNTGNMAHTPQPARPAGDGAPNVVVTRSNADVKPSVSAESSQAAKAAEQQSPSAAQLQDAVDNINKALKQASRNLEFSVDKSTNKPVVKVVDTDTGDLVRQFPSEEALAISRAIDQIQQGLLLKQEA